MSFLEKNTSLFMKELWALLVSAQQSDDGVPLQLVRAKQEEVRATHHLPASSQPRASHTPARLALQLHHAAAFVQCIRSACGDGPASTPRESAARDALSAEPERRVAVRSERVETRPSW
jgi:GAF domain-containing protein